MKRSRSELAEHAREQIDFLKASCASFDEGFEAECKRLAVHVRVLVHDRGRSRSILSQLGIKDSITFLSFKPPPPEAPPGATIVYMGSGLTMFRMSAEGHKHTKVPVDLATYDWDNATWLPFETWWTTAMIRDNAGSTFARQDIMENLAHKDGGAHVDDLPPTYRALSRRASLGWNPADPSIEQSPAPAAMRTIAGELVYTLEQQLPDHL